MIEINKNKLVPAITATWGDITGNIEKQQDLMSMMSSFATESWVLSQHYLSSAGLDAYATKAWVSDQGYLTSETLPSDLATESWVSSQGYITTSALSGYATESWVSSQGYLTSVPDSFATKEWVSDQGYLTSETLPSDLATQSWVSSQNFATESWVSSQGYLTSETLPSDLATESWVLSQGFATIYQVQNAIKPLPTKDDIFLNEVITPYGAYFTSQDPGCEGTNFREYWTTPSGRLFCCPNDGQNGVFEFINVDGYLEWRRRYMSVIPDYPAYQILNTGTNLFYIDGNNRATYLWDEANWDWTYICAAPTNPWNGNILITTDDTLRCDDGTKLTYNNGVWSWEQSAMVDQFIIGLPLLVGGTVYVMDAITHDLYTYDESTTTYTSVASDLPTTGECIFTVGGEFLFVTNYGTVAKWDSDLQEAVDTDIPYDWRMQPYFTYNKMLWTIADGHGAEIGCLGSTTISKPEVPASNGTYVLKATRSGDTVTYEWVADEVPQAVQITNEILS